MKKLLVFALLPILLTGCRGKDSAVADIYGVWANADCELVQTAKYSLLFERNGDTISVSLRQNIPYEGIVHSDFIAGYVFDGKERKYTAIEIPENRKSIPFDEFIKPVADKITVAGNSGPVTMELVEKIEIVPPYDMPEADQKNVGECLQAWQLGTLTHDMSPDNIWFEIGTNRGSYVFSSNPYSVYCRSARIRHNGNGSLFAQNIRLMSNRNEFTAHMEKDNLAVVRSPLRIDDSLFDADACVFADDGIYWSVASVEPEEIKLNGCGEIYTFRRPSKDEGHIAEWFAYAAY